MAHTLTAQHEPPRDARFDSTLALMRNPYRFIGDQCRQIGEDVFETRILLQKTVCMSGPDAARLFYDAERFMRAGAAPMRVQATLFGRGGVQALDGEPHHVRKAMLMRLMSPDRIQRLGDLSLEWWHAYARRWGAGQRVQLYRASRELLCRTVCEWAGVPLPEGEVRWRTSLLTALFESAGAVGPRHWWGRLARVLAQRWAGDVIERVRSGRLDLPADSAARVIAAHRESDGSLLDRRTAAVELLNVLRPTVAVAVYIVFVALALHRYPLWRRRLQEDRDGRDVECFVQEVRRFYPFFPAAVARVRRDFEWSGFEFPAGTRVMLDLYGTNHDPRAWDAPDAFRPERFQAWSGDAFSFVPQGGGDDNFGHRCAGEWATIELMKRAARFLARSIDYEVPPQDLAIDLRRLPALPASRFVIGGVRQMG